MKRYMLLLLAFVLVFSFVGIGTAAADVEPNEASAKCTWIADTFPGLFDFLYDSHGDCVSHYNSNSLNFNQPKGIWLCKFFAGLFDFPLGHCVSALNS